MKIGTLNLCLGLKNKKEEVKRLIKEKNIDILCVQETELETDYTTDILSFTGYNYESEENETKARVGIYISNKISYKRNTEEVGTNSHICSV